MLICPTMQQPVVGYSLNYDVASLATIVLMSKPVRNPFIRSTNDPSMKSTAGSVINSVE